MGSHADRIGPARLGDHGPDGDGEQVAAIGVVADVPAGIYVSLPSAIDPR